MMRNLTKELVDQYMAQIGPWNIKALARKYIYDFELFNYPLSKYLPMKPADEVWNSTANQLRPISSTQPSSIHKLCIIMFITQL